jgi:uncharacterized SAM-binding protein YcdF (DUF218 family)
LPAIGPPKPLRRQKPTRRPRHRHTPTKRRLLSWRGRAFVGLGLTGVALLAWASIARAVAPTSNTKLGRFDAIIVLGYPADSDGNPSPRMLARVAEGVREYERGVAPRLILTGGAAHNQFVEAQVMARTAEAEGIPQSAIVMEQQAKDTIQNGCYSARIMKERGWRSAEVVSSAAHLPRAGMIFDKLPIEWRSHAAPSVEPESPVYTMAGATVETLKTMRYLVYADWADRCEP